MPTNNFKVGEMLNKRTRNSKTWINFDGSYTTEIHSGDIHFEDENGNLQNINTDLFDEADFDIIEEPVAREGKERFYLAKKESKTAKGKNILNRDLYNFQGLKVPFDCHIPRNFKKGYTVGKGQSKLKFIPQNASPSKGYLNENDKSIITYQDVWNDTDVELKVLSNGIKETILLKTDRAPFSFSFEVQGKDIADDLTAGNLKILPAWLQDAQGTKRDVEIKVTKNNDNRVYLELNADVTYLVYPIEIDPTVKIASQGIQKDTYIMSNDTGNRGLDNNLVIGSTSYPYRILMDFDLSSVSGIIEKAELNLYCYSTGEPTFSALAYAIPIIQEWQENTVIWNNQPKTDSDVNHRSEISVNGGGYTTAGRYHKFDITTAIRNDTGYGFMMRTANEPISYSGSYLNYYYSKQQTYGAQYEPYLEVTYNQQPTAPTVTSPNGGETWNSLHTVSWNASTDAEGDSIQYQIQLTTDEGINWKDIVALTAAGATSYDYDFINEVESSLCKIRIRAFDGASYGPWDESDGVFTIVHNQAPTSPTNLSPNGITIDRASNQRFSWQHNDPNSNDPQSKFDLQWRLQGSSTWYDIGQVTINQFYDFVANNFPRGTIEWRVRTYDQAGLSSPYSDIATFFAGDKPSQPTIVSPGEAVAVANTTVQWSSDGQIGYALTVKDSYGATVFNVERNSTNKAETITYDLANQSEYTIELKIKNADGLYSDADTQAISVSYTPPAIPDIATLKGDSFIQINITDPEPTGTQPAVLYHDIYKEIDGKFVRIATNVANQYKDYAVASGENARYFVRTFGDNNTFSDTITFSESISFIGVWLHVVDDPENTVNQFKYDGGGRSSSWGLENAVHKFQGRKFPVIEIEEMEEYSIDFNLSIMDDPERKALERIIYSKQTICYRDGRGRKAFSIFTGAPLTDEFGKRYSTSLSLLKIDYSEEA